MKEYDDRELSNSVYSIYTIDEFEMKNGNVEVTATYLGDKKMFMDWYGNWHLKPVFLDEKRNKVWDNCDTIAKKLNENGLNVYVHRHTLFDIKCYVVTEKREGSKTFYDDDLAEILDIPIEWINLSKAKDPQEYYILEDEFNEKYCNEDGLVEFKPDLKEYWDKCDISGIKEYFAELFHISKDDVFVHWVGGEFVEIKLPKDPYKYDVDVRFSSLDKCKNTIIIKKEWL